MNESLDAFSEMTGSENWTDYPGSGWRDVVSQKPADPDVTVNVNLDGIRGSPYSLIQSAAGGGRGANFGWELNEIRLGNFDGPVVFWQNGVQVASPF
jgi:hypothetical protein